MDSGIFIIPTSAELVDQTAESYPDAASIQFEVVKVAYEIWYPIEKLFSKIRHKAEKWREPRTLPDVVRDIIPLFRHGAAVYIENPRYRGRKALGELILEALKDADPALLVKKFKIKAVRECRRPPFPKPW